MYFDNGKIDYNDFRKKYLDIVKKIVKIFVEDEKSPDSKYLIAENTYNIAIKNIELSFQNIEYKINDEKYASIVCFELCNMHIVHITDENILQNEICQNINCWVAILFTLKYVYNIDIKSSFRNNIETIVSEILYKHITRESIEKWFKDNIKV